MHVVRVDDHWGQNVNDEHRPALQIKPNGWHSHSMCSVHLQIDWNDRLRLNRSGFELLTNIAPCTTSPALAHRYAIFLCSWDDSLVGQLTTPALHCSAPHWPHIRGQAVGVCKSILEPTRLVFIWQMAAHNPEEQVTLRKWLRPLWLRSSLRYGRWAIFARQQTWWGTAIDTLYMLSQNV